MDGVAYSQSGLRADGYRPDCSGYAAMALGIPPGVGGGPNTAQLVTAGWVFEIPIDSLAPADLIGRLGPGTEGDAGHVQIFLAWDNSIPGDNGHTVFEQTPQRGPNERHYGDWTYGYRAYRYRGIVDDPAPMGRPYPLHYPPHYFGDIDGPDESHGGYWLAERSDVTEIQRALIRAGSVPGIANPFDRWADGIFDGTHDGHHPTTEAVRRFQAAHGCEIDGKVGPETWAALQPFMR